MMCPLSPVPASHHVCKLVKSKGISKHMTEAVVALNELLVGEPDQMSVQILQLR